MNGLRFQTIREKPPDRSFNKGVTVSNGVPSVSFLHTDQAFQCDAAMRLAWRFVSGTRDTERELC